MSNENAKVCRWGILGAAKIAYKNWHAIRNSGNGIVTSVASRDQDRAAEFVSKCQEDAPFETAPRVAEDYEAIITADDIDAVYVPLPTCIRAPILIALAKSGKHILSEKPCATDAAELSATIEECKKQGVQFMDGVMFRHSLRTDRIRDYIRDPEHFGKLTRIASHFSFYGDDDFRSNDIRTRSNLERFGCLGDLGWYNILFTLCMVDFELPERVSGNILTRHRDPSCNDAVPMSFSAELVFRDGVTASFYCSFESDLQQWASVGSTHGHVWLNDFVIPFSGRQPRFNAFHTTTEGEHCVMAMNEGKTEIEVNETSHGEVDSQETKLFRKFASIVTSGQLDWSWPEASLKTQTVMDACFQSGLSGQTIEL